MTNYNLLTLRSKDDREIRGSVGHESVPEFRNGVGGSAGGFRAKLYEVHGEITDVKSTRWRLDTHYSSGPTGCRGWDGYGYAVSHTLDIGVDIPFEEIEVSSEIFDIDDLFEQGGFTDRIGRRFSDRLHLPFRVGEITLLGGLQHSDSATRTSPSATELETHPVRRVPAAFQLTV